MKLLFDQGTPAPLRGRLLAHSVDTLAEKVLVGLGQSADRVCRARRAVFVDVEALEVQGDERLLREEGCDQVRTRAEAADSEAGRRSHGPRAGTRAGD